VDPDAAFRLCVQVSGFKAILDDGSSVVVPRKYAEWVVDSRCYTLGHLENDIAAMVKYGSRQQIVISEFDMGSGVERRLVDDNVVSVCFSDRQQDKKMFLYVDVEEKPADLLMQSGVTEVMSSNMVSDNIEASATIVSTNEPVVTHVIDWDAIEIDPIPDDQIGAAVPVMDEDAMFEILGLRAEDERAADEARLAAEKEKDMDLEGAELPVDDLVPGEETIIYDREDPPMKVGTIYACMNEFRAAARQHAIKNQFEMGIEKSCRSLFRAYCKAKGCEWSIVARTMSDKKQTRVYFILKWCTVNNLLIIETS
jgi:hypothetical protein